MTETEELLYRMKAIYQGETAAHILATFHVLSSELVKYLEDLVELGKALDRRNIPRKEN